MHTTWLYLLILGAGLLEIGGDFLLKLWADTERLSMGILGIFVYIIGIACWAFALKFSTLSSAVTMVTMVGLLLSVLIGVLYFGETLNGYQKLGVVLACVSIVLIELG
jgi:multidrug transporter EmrE-like cation transporter